jgi:hypothetical protein
MSLSGFSGKIVSGGNIMSQIILDPELRAKLNGLRELVEVRDESGNLVGRFLPEDAYQKMLYANIKSPLTNAELARREKEVGGCTLQEIWEKLGVQANNP